MFITNLKNICIKKVTDMKAEMNKPTIIGCLVTLLLAIDRKSNRENSIRT